MCLKIRIVECFCESALEDFRPVRRQAGRADVGPAESADRKYDRRQAFARFRSFVFVHELPDGRNFGQSRVALFAGLDQYANKTILEPRNERFPSEQGFDGDAAAVNFFALDRQLDFGTVLVSGKCDELCAECVLQ